MRSWGESGEGGLELGVGGRRHGGGRAPQASPLPPTCPPIPPPSSSPSLAGDVGLSPLVLTNLLPAPPAWEPAAAMATAT